MPRAATEEPACPSLRSCVLQQQKRSYTPQQRRETLQAALKTPRSQTERERGRAPPEWSCFCTVENSPTDWTFRKLCQGPTWPGAVQTSLA